MPRYIDADIAHEMLLRGYVINDVPTADVVEIVRCKDCIHRDPEDKKCDGTFQAKCGMFQMDDNDFCSYGKRRKEDVDA